MALAFLPSLFPVGLDFIPSLVSCLPCWGSNRKGHLAGGQRQACTGTALSHASLSWERARLENCLSAVFYWLTWLLSQPSFHQVQDDRQQWELGPPEEAIEVGGECSFLGGASICVLGLPPEVASVLLAFVVAPLVPYSLTLPLGLSGLRSLNMEIQCIS